MFSPIMTDGIKGVGEVVPMKRELVCVSTSKTEFVLWSRCCFASHAIFGLFNIFLFFIISCGLLWRVLSKMQLTQSDTIMQKFNSLCYIVSMRGKMKKSIWFIRFQIMHLTGFFNLQKKTWICTGGLCMEIRLISVSVLQTHANDVQID